MHKTGGSLTQSSFLLSNGRINPGYIRQIINLTQTTSRILFAFIFPGYFPAESGAPWQGNFPQGIGNGSSMPGRKINRIPGYYAFSKELVDRTVRCMILIRPNYRYIPVILAWQALRSTICCGMITTFKLSLGILGHILAIISVGDNDLAIERLVSALSEIRRRYAKDPKGMFDHEYINPVVVMTPQEAFYAPKHGVPIAESAGKFAVSL